MIQHDHDSQHGRLYRWSERGFEAVTNAYGRCLEVVLGYRVLTLFVTVATLAVTLWLYTITPKGFLP